MMQKEEQERASRKASLSAEQMVNDVLSDKGSNKGRNRSKEIDSRRKVSALDPDFNKQMRYVFDEDELRFRQKMQMFGNMKLICELFLRGLISADIIIQCLENLFDEITDMHVEILCHILQKLGDHVEKIAKRQLEGENLPKKVIYSKIDVKFI